MKKNIIIASALLSFIVISTPVFAQTATNSTSTYKECVASAQQNEDSSIVAAKDAYTKAVDQAKTTEKTALSAAKTKAEKTAAKKAYKAAIKTAKSDLKKAKSEARKAFTTAKTECKK